MAKLVDIVTDTERMPSLVCGTPLAVMPLSAQLGEFVDGMIAKLAKNAHKKTVEAGDERRIMALLLREAAEFLEQMADDRLDGNALWELCDIANFAFLAYVALKQERMNGT
jgi:hypothetical protein